VYTCDLRVRTYECDMLGHVNNAVYQQYLQEAAIAATAAVGYDAAWYAARGTAWVVRQMSLEYVRPARAGDELRVTTWISTFSRIRAQREYEIHRVGDGHELVVRASASWIYFDLSTGRPRAIPAEMIEPFDPSGAPNMRDYELPTEPMHCAEYEWRHRVAWHEIDTNRHVNNAIYLSWVEDARFAASEAVGWTIERMRDSDLVIVQVRHDTEYLLPALYRDEIKVASRLHEMRKVRGTWRHQVYREHTGELLAVNHSTGAFLTLAGRPRRLPDEMLADIVRGIPN
jgi:acyl-CoA thioester hydrolase